MKSGAEPWNQPKWRDGVVRPTHNGYLAIWLTAGIFLGISVFLYVKQPERFALRWSAETFVLLLPIIGLWSVPFAVVKTLRAWRFRGSVFRLDTLPGVIGGKLRGQLILPEIFSLGAAESLYIELINEKITRRRERFGGKRRIMTTRSRLFERSLRMDPQQLSFQQGRCSVPVEFVIPYETKDESDNYRKREHCLSVRYRWLLKVSGDIPGMDLDLTFEVPVYRTEQSDPAVIEAEPSEEESAGRLDQQRQRRRVRIAGRQGVPSYIAGAWPGWRQILLIGGLVVFFSVLGVFLARQGFGKIGGGGGKNTADLIFDNIFVAVFLLMALVVFGLVFLMLILFVVGFCRRETWIDGGILYQRLTLLGLSYVRKVPCARIERVDHASTGQVNGDPFFAVYVHHRVDKGKRIKTSGGGRKLLVADDIDTQEEAQWLVAQLNGQITGSDSQAEDRTNA